MRILGAGFGLLALLICVAIMLWLSAENASTVIPVGRKAQEDAEKIAGMSNGIHSADSVTLEPGGDGSRTTYLKVTKVVAGGPMANYGLQLNDPHHRSRAVFGPRCNRHGLDQGQRLGSAAAADADHRAAQWQAGDASPGCNPGGGLRWPVALGHATRRPPAKHRPLIRSAAPVPSPAESAPPSFRQKLAQIALPLLVASRRA